MKEPKEHLGKILATVFLCFMLFLMIQFQEYRIKKLETQMKQLTESQPPIATLAESKQ